MPVIFYLLKPDNRRSKIEIENNLSI
jgi:hypothetical protein